MKIGEIWEHKRHGMHINNYAMCEIHGMDEDYIQYFMLRYSDGKILSGHQRDDEFEYGPCNVPRNEFLSNWSKVYDESR